MQLAWQVGVKRPLIVAINTIDHIENRTLQMKSLALNGESRRLVTDELVGFRNRWLKVGDFWRITDHLRRIYRQIYPN